MVEIIHNVRIFIYSDKDCERETRQDEQVNLQERALTKILSPKHHVGT